MSDTYDLIVIGSGPGGYVAAIRAAQLGLRTACIEKDATLGGTCLNVGCIPSKALLESSERFAEAKKGMTVHGVELSGVQLNLSKMLKRKDGIVKQLTSGVEFLFKKNKVTRVSGLGRLAGGGRVEVLDDSGAVSATLQAAKILVATGSAPISIPGVELDGDDVVTSTEALCFDEVPEHLVVIGAGVIGLEMGSVWARLGAKVTILEYMPTFLPFLDPDVSKAAAKIFKKQGLDIQLGVKVTGTTVLDGKVDVSFLRGDAEEQLKADKVLVAVGRRPFTDGLGADTVGLELDARGRIKVDGHFKTNLDGVWAIGDVIAGPMLAHKAEEEGIAAVESMTGLPGHVNYDAIPGVVYTHPEVANLGKTSAELTEAGVPFKVGTFPFAANGRAKALGETEGMVKIIAHAETDRILGAQIVGPRAGALIAELAVAVEFSASAEDIARSVHAHPTLAEVVKEAALDVDGRVLHR